MVLPSLRATKALAQSLVAYIPKGALLILSGGLGTGKTTLTQHLGVALGAKVNISSPTYTLIHEYPTPEGILVHIDAYRLPEVKVLLDMGLDDYLSKARLVVVEWGEGLLDLYYDSWLLRLSILEGIHHAELIRHGKVISLNFVF